MKIHDRSLLVLSLASLVQFQDVQGCPDTLACIVPSGHCSTVSAPSLCRLSDVRILSDNIPDVPIYAQLICSESNSWLMIAMHHLPDMLNVGLSPCHCLPLLGSSSMSSCHSLNLVQHSKTCECDIVSALYTYCSNPSVSDSSP